MELQLDVCALDQQLREALHLVAHCWRHAPSGAGDAPMAAAAVGWPVPHMAARLRSLVQRRRAADAAFAECSQHQCCMCSAWLQSLMGCMAMALQDCTHFCSADWGSPSQFDSVQAWLAANDSMQIEASVMVRALWLRLQRRHSTLRQLVEAQPPCSRVRSAPQQELLARLAAHATAVQIPTWPRMGLGPAGASAAAAVGFMAEPRLRIVAAAQAVTAATTTAPPALSDAAEAAFAESESESDSWAGCWVFPEAGAAPRLDASEWPELALQPSRGQAPVRRGPSVMARESRGIQRRMLRMYSAAHSSKGQRSTPAAEAEGAALAQHSTEPRAAAQHMLPPLSPRSLQAIKAVVNAAAAAAEEEVAADEALQAAPSSPAAQCSMPPRYPSPTLSSQEDGLAAALGSPAALFSTPTQYPSPTVSSQEEGLAAAPNSPLALIAEPEQLAQQGSSMASPAMLISKNGSLAAIFDKAFAAIKAELPVGECGVASLASGAPAAAAPASCAAPTLEAAAASAALASPALPINEAAAAPAAPASPAPSIIVAVAASSAPTCPMPAPDAFEQLAVEPSAAGPEAEGAADLQRIISASHSAMQHAAAPASAQGAAAATPEGELTVAALSSPLALLEEAAQLYQLATSLAALPVPAGAASTALGLLRKARELVQQASTAALDQQECITDSCSSAQRIFGAAVPAAVAAAVGGPLLQHAKAVLFTQHASLAAAISEAFSALDALDAALVADQVAAAQNEARLQRMVSASCIATQENCALLAARVGLCSIALGGPASTLRGVPHPLLRCAGHSRPPR